MATQAESGPPASARPTGTVTFLFSDIEGSTSRWDANREAMAPALARHDALLRTALEAHGAYIFKTIGDAFCAAFATAANAIAAALDAQRTLAGEDFSAVSGLRVRMAVHTGTAEERDGDYFGPTVNRVARLLAVGHGGQVLVSGSCAELLHSEMPPQSSLRDLGEHRLRDLARPEQVYQVVAPPLPESFPPLRSVSELPNNLPRQLTSFVGRDEVVSEVAALVNAHPLVTLVGTGGAGKTRCAIQVGAEMLDGSGDGVWLAELAPISDSALVAGAVAQALNVQEQPNRPVLETLVAYLKRKHLLLILDNCEHVIEEARQVVSAILQGCPEVRILATSREGLNVAGERVYRMPSLRIPRADETITTDGALAYGSVALFAERALSSDGRFTLTSENLAYVAEICRRLDGIPLAIELAAARVKILSPKQLAQKLDERFRVLTGGDRSALPRQQTMRALIDWSYDLLSSDERTLFRKLSIFAGGFTLETATAVCSEGEMDEIIVMDLLSSLVDKSLVQAEAVGENTRYRLLESTRQYAREKLSEAGGEDAVARAHTQAFLALALRLTAAFETTPDREWYAQAEAELENFRTALTWTFSPRGDVRLGQQLAGQRIGWERFGRAEGRRWVRLAQDRADDATPPAVLGALDLAEAHLASALTQQKAALAAGERALARYRQIGDPGQIAACERMVGAALISLGQIAEGEAFLQQALGHARALGARRLAARTLHDFALARQFAGDPAGARQRYSEALAALRAIGAENMMAQISSNLAEVEFRAGDPAAALQRAHEALAVSRALHYQGGIATDCCNTAAYLVALRRYDDARAAAREALLTSRDVEFSVAVAFSLQHLAAVGALQPSSEGQVRDVRARAARLLGYVDARLLALEAQREYTEQQEYDAMMPALRDALGDDELMKLMAEGSTWSEDQAVAEAMLI